MTAFKAILPVLALLGCSVPRAEEPAQGMLKPGDVVRVDDGAYAAGEVRRIAVGPPPADKTLPSPRVSSCVRR